VPSNCYTRNVWKREAETVFHSADTRMQINVIVVVLTAIISLKRKNKVKCDADYSKNQSFPACFSDFQECKEKKTVLLTKQNKTKKHYKTK